MTSCPTDLDAAETARARSRLAELADELTEQGSLGPQWREVFLATWRHPYVPAYYPSLDRPPVLCVDDDRRAAWLDDVYSNQTLITKVVALPLSRAFSPATGWAYTSSCTLPGLVLRMLDTLDIRDGNRVLEIGTGTGYTSALLCQRLGSAAVTSIDIDVDLVDLARERLAANGHTPTLHAADGAAGDPTGHAHDRIIATCSVPAVPTAWLHQTRPGGVIVTALSGQLGGALVRLVVDHDHAATGRFLPRWGGFMALRHTSGPRLPTPPAPIDTHGERPYRSTTRLDPRPLLREADILGFLAQLHLPDVTRGAAVTDDGRPAVALWSPDGSHALLEATADTEHRCVIERGPRRLWRIVEQAHLLWQSHGRPGYERFGVTASATGQHVWLDEPTGPRWRLPVTL